MRKRVARMVVCLLWLLYPHLVEALPPGYKDDFNGCATQSPDSWKAQAQNRERKLAGCKR